MFKFAAELLFTESKIVNELLFMESKLWQNMFNK